MDPEGSVLGLGRYCFLYVYFNEHPCLEAVDMFVVGGRGGGKVGCEKRALNCNRKGNAVLISVIFLGE